MASSLPRATWLLSAALALAATTARAQELIVTLTGSMHNGTEIPCFGKKEGTVTSSVSGGTAPYTYLWTNGATGTSISGVAAGYYSVEVKDAEGVYGRADITLTEPEALKVSTVVSAYTNGHNISCFECSNGYVQVTPTQGTPPYTYAWADGPYTTRNRYTLGPGEYSVTVTDANGCAEKATQKLTQPERSGWSMEGNTGTDPATQFIGTADSAAVVFKANGQQSLRLDPDGGISLLGDMLGEGVVVRDSEGRLRVGSGGPVFEDPCGRLKSITFWSAAGNTFPNLCPDDYPVLGTLNPIPVRLFTNNVERMRIRQSGHAVLGNDLLGNPLASLAAPPPSRLSIIQPAASNWLSLHREGDAAFWGLRNPQEQDRLEFYFKPAGGDAVHHILKLHNNGKVSIGDVSTDTDQTYDYALYVHKGILTEKVKVALKTSSEWSDHVFQPNYRLMPLKDVESFIKKHGHLPGVPSAEQMVEQGLDVAKTDAMLMEKIEEITLHMIAMEKRMAELEAENAAQRTLLKKMRP